MIEEYSSRFNGFNVWAKKTVPPGVSSLKQAVSAGIAIIGA